jgi:hypothetical protein
MGEDAEGDALRNKYLLPLVKKLIGTRSTPEVEVKRVYFLTDQAIRVFAPLALEETGLTEIAETLRALPKTIGPQTADQAAFVAHSAFASVASAYAIATTAVTGITAAKCATDATTAKDAAYAAAIAAYEAAADADPTYTAAETATEAARIAVHAVAWEQAAQVLAEACEITVNEHEE